MATRSGRARSKLGALALAAVVALSPLAAPAFDRLVFSVGGDDPSLKETLKAASLLIVARRDDERDPRDVLAAAQADYGRLLGALYGEGYYGSVINILIDGREAAGFSPFEAPERIGTVRVKVSPGPQFRFGTARVAPLPRRADPVEAFRSGEIARSGAIVDAAAAGVSAWRDAGRAKAKVSGQRIVANHPDARLDADITLSPGPVVRFGDLVQTTPSSVRAERIARIAGLPTGTRFSPAKLDDVAERLRRTGAFASVALTEAETLGPGNTMDIELAVADEKPRRFGFGVELSTLEGASLSGFWLHRNLLGGAERLRVDAEIAGIDGTLPGMDATLAARLDIPAAITSEINAYVGLEAAYHDEPAFQLWQGAGEAGLHRQFSRRLEGSLGLAYRYAIARDDLGTRRFSMVSMPGSLSWDRRDDPLDPTRGTYIAGELEPFYEIEGANAGARAWIDARGYFGLADDRLVLAGRGLMGYVAGTAAVAVPPDFLFFSGGGDTVRGFPYQSLGVDLGGGDVIGGRAFLGGSAELRYKAGEKIGLVAFADVGHVGAASFFDAGGDWQFGAGAGLRYDTGLGPIRLDVGFPVSGPGGAGPQFYLGIGQAF